MHADVPHGANQIFHLEHLEIDIETGAAAADERDSPEKTLNAYLVHGVRRWDGTGYLAPELSMACARQTASLDHLLMPVILELAASLHGSMLVEPEESKGRRNSYTYYVLAAGHGRHEIQEQDNEDPGLAFEQPTRLYSAVEL